MSDYRRTLRDCLHGAAFTLQMDWSIALKRGRVQDFLLEPCESFYSPQQFMAKAVEYLCRNDDCGIEMDMLVCAAATMFLDVTVGSPPEDDKRMRMRDLFEMIRGDGPLTATEIENWANSWYG